MTPLARTGRGWSIAAATAVALGLRLFHLGTQSLWIDEILTHRSADVGAPMPLPDLLQNVHGPLYALLLNLWTRLAGDSEWAMRLPSALFGTAMVPAMAAVATLWLGAETAVLAAWLAALSPFLVWYSQEARNYALLMLCACLAAVALLRLRESLTGPRVAAAIAALAAGVLAGFPFALLAPLHLKWWLSGGSRGRRALLVGAGVLAVILVASPWIPQAVRTWDFRRLQPGAESGTPLRGTTTFHPAALPFALHAFAVGYTLGPSLRELRSQATAATLARHAPELVATALVFGLLGLLGLRALARRRRLLDALLWIVVPALIVSFFATRNFKVFHPRYVAVSAPAVLLVIAAALADLPVRLRIAAALAVALLWGASLAHHAFDPRYAKEDYRGASAFVASRARPDERVLAVGAEDPVFHYYRGPAPLDRLWLGFVQRPARLQEKWDEARSGVAGVWVVLSRPEDLDPEGRFTTFMESETPESYRLEGIRIWHWTAPGSASAPAVR